MLLVVLATWLQKACRRNG